MIDTDTRQLRRGDEGHYFAGNGKRICDHCGHNDVCAHRPMACSLFMPAFPFVGQVGMDRLFNTTRIGSAWLTRLSQGQTVALYDTKAKTVFGHATVLGLFNGQIDAILKVHAQANHLMLETPAEDAPEILHDWLKRNYGPRIITPTTRLTAIYLLRQHGTPAAPNFDGHEALREAEGQPADDR